MRCEFEFGVFLFDGIELATALECQKQLLMSGISNSSGRESLEIAVKIKLAISCMYGMHIASSRLSHTTRVEKNVVSVSGRTTQNHINHITVFKKVRTVLRTVRGLTNNWTAISL